MSEQTFSKKEAVRFAYQSVSSNFKFWIEAMVFAIFVLYFPEAISKIFEKIYLPGVAVIFMFFLKIFFWALSVVLYTGLAYVSVLFCENKAVFFQELFSKTDRAASYFFSSLLYGLVVALGFLMFVIPGVIFMIRFQFYQYYAVSQGMSPVDALKASWRDTKGSFWNLFAFGFVLAGINILGALCLGIGLLFTIPISMVSSAYVYKKLAR